MNPQYPVYIPTKGRSESRMTIRMFDRYQTDYMIFVEEQDYDNYAQYVDCKRIHVLPHENQGVTITRNYIWDYAASQGVPYYWTFDDNIDGLYRFNNNLKTPCGDSTILYVMEEFVKRYDNIAIAGPNYCYFVKRKYLIPPYILNTRVYSAMLIKTLISDKLGKLYRWETFFNEDTDLCLRVLKDGYCTVLFNAFLIDKKPTMTMIGGNREYYDKTDKRREFVEELQRKHSDVVKLTEKWGRYHHHVDYSRFRQQLKRLPGIEIPNGINNYGMKLQERKSEQWVDAS